MRRVSRRNVLNKAINSALKKSLDELYQEFQRVIREPRQWDGFENSTTYRANGSVVVGSFRNIEDLGNLLSSQKLDLDGNNATFSWDGNGITPVVDVFFGRRTETGYIPGRDWIREALDDYDFAESFKYYMKSEASK